MTDTTELDAFIINGVGGLVARSNCGVVRVLRLATVSGREVNVVLDCPEVAKAIVKGVTDIQIAELETGEVMRELNLYDSG